ncbi:MULTISPECIES: RNA polymerase sigma factor [Streptomyces]|uniref:RNA polymerase sigma factor n=1 Tax=Streptomyces TaxID=1883 RepID=UPI00211D2ECF|nr:MULTISPECIES: sigma-70 family RNA polymerase sigma factor [Streptomyces]MCX4506662.1 sigma-70 family RNA polymerase sigma factor [Streptomyces anulatus]
MDSMIEEQFTAMYRCHRVAVERYVLRRVQAEDVGDVLAEVFLTAWRRYEQIPADPLPWLYGVARRVLANDRRAARRRRDLSDRLAVQPQPRADAHAEDVAGLTDVARAFSRLSSQDQEVLRLCLWEELTPSEIAQVLGQAQIAVRVRLHRARQRLQKHLRPISQIPPASPVGIQQEAKDARH